MSNTYRIIDSSKSTIKPIYIQTGIKKEEIEKIIFSWDFAILTQHRRVLTIHEILKILLQYGCIRIFEDEALDAVEIDKNNIVERLDFVEFQNIIDNNGALKVYQEMRWPL